MKLLLTGDWHLTMEKPVNRLDNYLEAQVEKLQFIAEQFGQGCSYVLQPGDFFDSHRANDLTKQFFIGVLREMFGDKKILTVAGQHDMRFHNSDISNTPLKVIEKAQIAQIIAASFLSITNSHERVNIYGSFWGDNSTPEILPDHKNDINIWVLHRMIIYNKKEWEAQEDYDWANHLLIQTKFDLIVAGDNHRAFSISRGKRHLVNCGSLMRSNIDQMDHQPCIFIWDSDTKEIEKIDIPVKDFTEVMDLTKEIKRKEDDKNLKAFIGGLSTNLSSSKNKLTFRNNLSKYVADNEASIGEGTIGIINEVIEELR